MKSTDCIMERLILEFLDWLQVIGFAKNTLRKQKFSLRMFYDWCSERGITDPAEVTVALIDRYQKYISRCKNHKTGRVIAVVTQRYMLSTLKSFYAWLTKKKNFIFNPTIDIELPRQARLLPRNILTVEEVEKILSVPDLDTAFGVRDRAILELFYSTGIRRSELENLKIGDIDFSGETIFVREGKGKKDRLIPVARRALEWIEKYLEEVRVGFVKEPDEGDLFLGIRGERFGATSIGRMVTDARKRAGVTKEGSTHMFRHTTATLMLENGADIRYVQEMLGHSNLSSTQIYTHVAIRKLKEVHENTHPSNRVAKSSGMDDLTDTS